CSLLLPGACRVRSWGGAARQNDQAWVVLGEPVGLLWSFVGGQPLINAFRGREVPASTAQAEAMSRALRKAGFTFVGPTICYAFMQASGMVMDHSLDCDRYLPLAGAADGRGCPSATGALH